MSIVPFPADVRLDEEHLFFVTGKLASPSLHELLAAIAPEWGFRYTIQTLPITVAALMSPGWISGRWHVPDSATRIILPGYCLGDLDPLHEQTDLPIHRGPRDLREIPVWLGIRSRRDEDYGGHDIQIIAEINHAPQLTIDELLMVAAAHREDGADLIDVGCEPSGPWEGVGDAVAALVEAGHRVSIDSLDPREIAPAVASGAELVLSVNATNRDAAADWGCEVVVIPDDFPTLGGLDDTLQWLDQRHVKYRIDPILEPIGMGFAASLRRYMDVRQRFPDAEMMMGIGNLTELTDVDSAGINVLLLAICQELGIRSVLTTQVINWARSSVRECDLARRLLFYSVNKKVVPKHLEPMLVMLRDTKVAHATDDELRQLAASLKDQNYRLFEDGTQMHIVAGGLHLSHDDPFVLFDELLRSGDDGKVPRNIDLGHAFYLGYELSKAMTAITLGKQYRQDESLDWGMLTREEMSHRERKTMRKREQSNQRVVKDQRPEATEVVKPIAEDISQDGDSDE